MTTTFKTKHDNLTCSVYSFSWLGGGMHAIKNRGIPAKLAPMSGSRKFSIKKSWAALSIKHTAARTDLKVFALDARAYVRPTPITEPPKITKGPPTSKLAIDIRAPTPAPVARSVPADMATSSRATGVAIRQILSTSRALRT